MLRMLGDRLAVRVHEPERVSPGGIYLPAADDGDPHKATVVSAGKDVEFDVGVGDTIMFCGYVGSDIEVDGERLRIIRDKDVLFVTDG